MRALTRMRRLAAALALLLFIATTAVAGVPGRPIDRPEGPPETNPTEVGDPDTGATCLGLRSPGGYVLAADTLEISRSWRIRAADVRQRTVDGQSASDGVERRATMATSVLEQAATAWARARASHAARSQFAASLDCCARARSPSRESQRAHWSSWSSDADSGGQVRLQLRGSNARRGRCMLWFADVTHECAERAQHALARHVRRRGHSSMSTSQLASRGRWWCRLNRAMRPRRKLQAWTRLARSSAGQRAWRSMCPNGLASAHIRAGRVGAGLASTALEALVSATASRADPASRASRSESLHRRARGDAGTRVRGSRSMRRLKLLRAVGAMVSCWLTAHVRSRSRCSSAVTVRMPSEISTRVALEGAELLQGPQRWLCQLTSSLAHLHLGNMPAASEQLQTVFYDRGEIPGIPPRAPPPRIPRRRRARAGPTRSRAQALRRSPPARARAHPARRRRRRTPPPSRRVLRSCSAAQQEAYDEAKAGLELCLELGDRYEEAATYRTLALAAAARSAGTTKRRSTSRRASPYYDDIETPYEWGKLWMAYGDWLCGPHAGAYESLTARSRPTARPATTSSTWAPS